MKSIGVDLILFAGGDGTAINILSAVGENQPCLGIPTGCKIYSGVFGITPELTAEMLIKLISGEMVDLTTQSVLDIDEQSFRDNQVRTKVYGEMCVPRDGEFVQAVKVAGIENEELALQEIAAWFSDTMDPDLLYLLGTGRTCYTLKEMLSSEATLLGVDAIYNNELVCKDATENELVELIKQYGVEQSRLIISFIGGQGILLGRGNHQIAHEVIRLLGKERLIIVSTKSKVKALEGRPLHVDTGDANLNAQIKGYSEIITGYEDRLLYPIG